jgi:hypothetical protein
MSGGFFDKLLPESLQRKHFMMAPALLTEAPLINHLPESFQRSPAPAAHFELSLHPLSPSRQNPSNATHFSPSIILLLSNHCFYLGPCLDVITITLRKNTPFTNNFIVHP